MSQGHGRGDTGRNGAPSSNGKATQPSPPAADSVTGDGKELDVQKIVEAFIQSGGVEQLMKTIRSHGRAATEATRGREARRLRALRIRAASDCEERRRRHEYRLRHLEVAATNRYFLLVALVLILGMFGWLVYLFRTNPDTVLSLVKGFALLAGGYATGKVTTVASSDR